MFACLQCTVCILNASSPCAPRVKKIRPIVGLLVVSVDTLRLEEASINIDPPHFERCVYFNIWERFWNCKGCTFPYSRCDINGWWFDLSYLVLSRIVQLVVELVLLAEVGRRLNKSWRDQKNSYQITWFAIGEFFNHNDCMQDENEYCKQHLLMSHYEFYSFVIRELFTSFFRLMIFTGCDIWGLWIFWQQATTCGVWLADWPGERAGNGGVPADNHHLVIIWSYWSANKYQCHHYLFMYPKIGKT